jgi:hypothetical protein
MTFKQKLAACLLRYKINSSYLKMNLSVVSIFRRLSLMIIWVLFFYPEYCFANFPTGSISTKQEAFDFLNTIDQNKESNLWPNIKPKLFYDNLKLNLENPMSFYPGRSTNFCSYGAVSYLVMQCDPLGYVRFMYQLYADGKANYNGNYFHPSAAVMKAAGSLRFKGVLDIRHAEQMWFLVLADKFKGYLNIINKKFNPGDENTFWASTNLAKYNRMVRKMCHYKSESVGSDLIKPGVKDLYSYLNKRMDSTTIVTLYINNRIIHKKTHDKVKFSIPTHYIILRELVKVNDLLAIRYWDYGGETLLQLYPDLFKKIVFGISIFRK